MPTTGDPTYLAELDRDRELHIAKAAGYTGDSPDAWANFREAERWGSTALEGCFIRMGDKYRRAQSVYANPAHNQVGETLLDTLRDLGAYARIAVCLLLEQDAKEVRLREKIDDVFGVIAQVNGHDETAEVSTTGTWIQRALPTDWDNVQAGNHTHGPLMADLTHSHAGQDRLHRHSARAV